MTKFLKMIYSVQMQSKLNAEKALIFRIVHRDNMPWILTNGLFCRNADEHDPNYRAIGNAELIAKRQTRSIPVHPGGSLSDYIPFYFTPFSPMMYNIKTGRGVTHVPNQDIVILVSSIHKVVGDGVDYIFSDRHAYLKHAYFYNEIKDVGEVDWTILQKRDFSRDPNDPEKMERYQAEALIHKHLPVSSLVGVVCYTDTVTQQIHDLAAGKELPLRVVKQIGWYF